MASERAARTRLAVVHTGSRFCTATRSWGSGASVSGATLLDMTAKEKLLQEAPAWSEEQAAIALRAVEGATVDEWGSLDAWSAAVGGDTMRMLDEEDAAAGFSWERRSSS